MFLFINLLKIKYLNTTMKKTLLVILCLISVNLYAQRDEDEDDSGRREHKKHKNYERDGKQKNDYFSLGIYTGTYIGKQPVKEKNSFFNSISAEIEYFKFKDLSLVDKRNIPIFDSNVVRYAWCERRT